MKDSVSSSQSWSNSIRAFVTGHEVLTFVILTLAISWSGWIPVAAGIVNSGLLRLGMTVIGVLGPPVAAAIVTWLVGDSVRAWAGQVVRFRVSPRWYLIVLGFPLVLIALTSVAHVALGYSIERPSITRQGSMFELPILYALHLVALSVIGGGQEELGWRGFALPRLLDRFDAVVASVVLGAVWAVWHLPLFVMKGESQYGTAFAPYLLSTVALSIVFTWLYRGSGRSVLLAVLFHANINASTLLTPVQSPANALVWFEPMIMWVFVLGLVVVYGRALHSVSDSSRNRPSDMY